MDEEQAGDIYLTESYSDLQKNWFSTNEPYKYLTCKTPQDIEIRVGQPLIQTCITDISGWEFTINIAENSSKQLWKVILLPECNPNVFHLQSVHIENKINNINKKIGQMSNLEWIPQNIITMHQQAKRYSVKIKCELKDFGVYRTIVFFNFGDLSSVFRRLCVDCTTNDRHTNLPRQMTQQHLAQISSLWLDHVLFPTADEYDNREKNMSNVYPFPNEDNFCLTHISKLITKQEVTREHYREHLHEAISLEEITVNMIMLQYSDINLKMVVKTPIAIKINSGSRINDSQFELLAMIMFKRKLLDGKWYNFFLNECDHALIKRRKYDTCILKVPIVRRTATSVYFGLHKDCVERWQLKKYDRVTVDVQFVVNRLKFCNWHWAVDSLEYIHGETFYEKLLLMKVTKKQNVEMEMTRAQYLRQLDAMYARVRDQIQAKAINVILNREENDLPILISGCAGTGKKYTIAKSIHKLMDLESRVLLCTKSDAVADRHIKQYFDVFTKLPTSLCVEVPVRIYNKRYNPATVDPNILRCCLMDDQMRFCEPNKEDLRRHKIIVTTLRDSFYLMHKELQVTHIIIDEADTVAEWEILIPILVANEKTRLIFVGELVDRLTPDCYSDWNNTYTSILERLYMHETYYSNERFNIVFDTVYRMHPKIAEFIYLEHGREFRQGISEENFPKHPTMATMTFYAVCGREEEDKTENMEVVAGYKNEFEAQQLVKRVQELKNAWPSDGRWGLFDKQSIGIITCFTAQVHRLRNELYNRGINVTVEDVYNARGMEYTVVFISTVVSYMNRIIDEKQDCFISNPTLIYIAITRAKNAVAVVGNPRALTVLGDKKCQNLWQKYIKVADLYGNTL